MRTLLALVFTIALSGNPMMAQDVTAADSSPRGQILTETLRRYTDIINTCAEELDVGSPQNIACLKRFAAQEDDAVNAAYEQSMRIIVPARRAEVKKIQTSWTAFYRATCDFEKPAMDLYYDCIIKMAIERTVELRNRIGD